MSKENPSIKKIFDSAFLHYQNGNLKKAEVLFKKVLESIPEHFSSIFLLGTLSAQIKKYKIAKKFLKQSIVINPKYAEAHNNLGNVFQELENNQEAITCYQEAIKINPKYAEAYYNLGRSFQNLDKTDEAISGYQEAIKINPKYAEAHNNLGNVFQELENNQEAITCYQEAIKINPKYAEAYYNLGRSFQNLDKTDEAISGYQEAIKINPKYAEAHNNLGNVFQELENNQEAITCYQEVIKINPKYVKGYNNLGKILNKLHRTQEAIKCFKTAIQIEPRNLTSHWLSMNTFPIIYENSREINIYRRRFEANINKINKLLDFNSIYSKKQIIDALTSSTNFFLHYQGKDNLKLQKKYANIVEKLTQKIYPQFYKERKKNTSSKYIKIGFVSSLFKNHSVSKTHKNWILKLERNFFKTYIYYAGKKFDQITNQIKENVNFFYNFTKIEELIDQISKDNLDILIYLDIGMNPKMQILASLRLAHTQCNTWGHPITSGFKNIDYFFSSALMETANSQKEYSEKLINLPGIGIDYSETDISEINTPNFLKDSDKVVFFNLQSLFKLLPQDDHIYIDILTKIPNSLFWFIQGESNSITSIFKKRISKLFQSHDLSFDKYFIFHPRCSLNEFLGLIEKSDIILDSFNWSGCNTSFDAISLNKPIVTLPSKFMRGRHTYSFLKKLNIEETIANSKKDYVEIAIRLANDSKFRNNIIEKIIQNKRNLFNDNKPINFLEKFLKKL